MMFLDASFRREPWPPAPPIFHAVHKKGCSEGRVYVHGMQGDRAHIHTISSSKQREKMLEYQTAHFFAYPE